MENANESGAYLESQGQYIKSLSLIIPNAPAIFSMMESAPEVEVQCNVDATRLNDNFFEVVLSVTTEAKITTKDNQKKVAFTCDLKYAGLFSSTATTDEELRKLMLVDAASILFPFARRVVSTATMDAGFPPLMLAPIDFAGKYVSQSEVQNPQ